MAGKIQEVFIATGDKVSEGSPIASIGPDSKEESGEAEPQRTTPVAKPEPTEIEPQQAPTSVAVAAPPPPPTLPTAIRPSSDDNPHASPGVRRFARELGADLTRISGSGPKGRILKTDVQQWIKKALTEPVERAPAAPAGSGIPEIPEIDFTQFGDVETRPLSRIKKLTATNLSRAWLNVPHVTQHDEADITELEEFRKQLKDEAVAKGEARITMLSFLMKACVVALKEFPAFNSSLQKGGQNLILKKYYHLGIAVDTEEGLVVPVVKDVDRKSIRDLAAELGVGAVERNPFRSIVVRALETFWAFEEALAIVDRYEEPDEDRVEVEPRAGTGHGCSEAPRGICWHRYRIDDAGTILDARIVPPTSQNQKTIESDLLQFAQANLDLPDDRLQWRCEQAIRNYDPCISCATHHLRVHIERE